MLNKAIFFDRDGTVNIDKNYVYLPIDLEFLPNAVKGLKRFQKRGFLLIIITNQSGIGRGFYSEREYKNLMDEFYKRLGERGIKITADYYCKHDPKDSCDCRKPNSLLIKKAIKKHKIDVSKSYFIGDKTTDILAGEKLGLTTVLVLTGKAGKDNQYKVKPDFICENLYEASKVIAS